MLSEGMPRPLPGIYPHSSLTSALAAQKETEKSPHRAVPSKKASPVKKTLAAPDSGRTPQANGQPSPSHSQVGVACLAIVLLNALPIPCRAALVSL